MESEVFEIPAPNSILVETFERKPFAPVDTAISIYKETLRLCLKMPKRYTYLILQDVIHLAGEVMDYSKKANSVFAHNAHEQQIRIDFWIYARSSLQALSTRIDRFLEVPGTLNCKDEETGKSKRITRKELLNLLDLIISEQNLLTNQIKEESEKLNNY